MQFALYLNKKKEAEPKQKGICPHCKQEVIAKCGSKNVWHWAHTASENCDSWWERETLWHRNWKKLFGEAYSEIRIQKENDYHIADVVNKSGIVFEFQNSPISAEVIKMRENFYGTKMIWIINGVGFKNNFQILDEAFLKNWKVHILDEFSAANYKKITNSLIIEDWQLKRPEVIDFLKTNGFVHNAKEKVFSLDLSERKHTNRELLINKLTANLLDLYMATSGNEFSGNTEFTWENPRRCWQDALRPVFIDFGEDFIYYITSGHGKKSGSGTKIPKMKFTEKYCEN